MWAKWERERERERGRGRERETVHKGKDEKRGGNAPTAMWWLQSLRVEYSKCTVAVSSQQWQWQRSWQQQWNASNVDIRYCSDHMSLTSAHIHTRPTLPLPLPLGEDETPAAALQGVEASQLSLSPLSSLPLCLFERWLWSHVSMVSRRQTERGVCMKTLRPQISEWEIREGGEERVVFSWGCERERERESEHVTTPL